MRNSLPFLLILTLIFMGCSPALPEAAVITFQLPAHPDLNEKSVAAANNPNLPLACYGVAVSAADLGTQKPLRCGPSLGIFTGFFPPSTKLTLEIPRGEARQFQLLLYLAANKTSCPTTEELTQVAGDQLYIMGEAGPLPLLKSEEAVTIVAQFPGVQNHFAKQANLGTSCRSLSTPEVTIVGSPWLVGEHYQLRGDFIPRATLTGTHYTLKLEEVRQ